MARFLLVHGASHSAWHWHLTVDALQALGHDARAIDLPAHGDDPTPPGSVSMDSYARAILAALPDEPAVLVGHSMAGFPVTEAAARAPARVARLVYLCAFVPEPGKTMAEISRQSVNAELRAALRIAPDRLTYSFDAAEAPRLFYNGVPPRLAAEATTRLCPEPLGDTQDTPVAMASGPRSYILCAQDNTIAPDHQARMAAVFAPGDVHRLDCGHSPFLSHPGGLAQLLAHIANPLG